ncbi:Wzz/FepE/Etk N-terminal domain-containing protein [Planococcus sp. SIMBA_143]
MDARQIFGIGKRFIGLILLMAFAGAVVAGVISYFFMTPLYQSTTQLLVSREAGETQELTEQNIKADLQLVNTYSSLIKSTAVLGKVSEQLPFTAPEEELRSQIKVDSAEDSQLIDITVIDSSQKNAVEIANATATIFQQEVKTLMNSNNVKILSPAVVNDDAIPVSPEPIFNIIVGLAVGFMFGIGAAFLLAYLDTSIKDEEDVRNLLGVPVLANIPPIDGVKEELASAKVGLQEKEA